MVIYFLLFRFFVNDLLNIPRAVTAVTRSQVATVMRNVDIIRVKAGNFSPNPGFLQSGIRM